MAPKTTIRIDDEARTMAMEILKGGDGKPAPVFVVALAVALGSALEAHANPVYPLGKIIDAHCDIVRAAAEAIAMQKGVERREREGAQ